MCIACRFVPAQRKQCNTLSVGRDETDFYLNLIDLDADNARRM